MVTQPAGAAPATVRGRLVVVPGATHLFDERALEAAAEPPAFHGTSCLRYRRRPARSCPCG